MGGLFQSIIDIFITLIPKVKELKKVIKFKRPINLCNNINEIVAKLLANQLIKVLPEISPPINVLLI